MEDVGNLFPDNAQNVFLVKAIAPILRLSQSVPKSTLRSDQTKQGGEKNY